MSQKLQEIVAGGTLELQVILSFIFLIVKQLELTVGDVAGHPTDKQIL